MCVCGWILHYAFSTKLVRVCVCVCKIVNVIGLMGMGGERDKKLEIFGLLNYGFSMYVWMKVLFGIWGNVWMDGLVVC